MVYLRLVFDERVYILDGAISPYSTTGIGNGNANGSAQPYPVPYNINRMEKENNAIINVLFSSGEKATSFRYVFLTLKRKPHGLVISRAETVNHPVVIHYKSYCRRTFDEEKETAYYIIIWR